jgi:hypothetical protein
LRALGLSLSLATLLGPACTKDANPPAKTDTRPAQDAVPDETPQVPSGSTATALLDWLDPDAVAVAYADFPAGIDPTTLSVVLALPPRVETMLRNIADIDEGLDAIRPLDGLHPAEWLDTPALASAALVSTGTYVLRPLLRPRTEAKALLLRSGMTETEVEGITILVPQNAFPWKVALLDERVVAFIPVREVGTGLSPLTAGRDLPASEIELQLRTLLDREPGVVLEAYAVGPLLHYDLGQDVLQLAVSARTWQRTGLDAQVRLLPSGDVTQAVEALSDRRVPLETDQVQALAGRVAFGLDGTAISGRIQLTPTDMATLGGGG